MTIKSWKKEFYPVPAENAAKTDLMALRHTLKKYLGLRKENIKKHELLHLRNVIQDDNDCFVFSGNTCALCEKYNDNCDNCPITKQEGESCNGSDDNVYLQLANNGNPEPMIELMKILIKKEQRKNAKKRGKK